MNKIIASSQNPEQLSATVAGALTTILTAVASLAVQFGFTAFPATEVAQIIDVISNVVLYGAMLVGALMTLFGAVRKVWKHFFKK